METPGNGKRLMRFWKHLKTYTQTTQHPALDPTTPWYEFISYSECCNSLGINPSINTFVRYNEYFKEILSESK